jgi:hypothetical protein
VHRHRQNIFSNEYFIWSNNKRPTPYFGVYVSVVDEK